MITRLTNLFGTRRSEERRLAHSVEDGHRVYAIGDIHGRNDLLQAMLAKLEADAEGFTGQVTLVGMGDYIDRGPDSMGVVETLMNGVPAGWQKVFLRGNHEGAMLDFLKEPEYRGEWLAWGGLQALESYGIQAYGARGMREVATLAAEFDHAITENGHKAFYEATQLMHKDGDYLFVHAGVRRGIPADQQMEEDLLFIREDFMGRPHGLPQRVVFGHTILAEPLVADDRIGLDTGAFQSGVLTAVRLEGEDAQIIQATLA